MILLVGAMHDEELSSILNNLDNKEKLYIKGISLYKGIINQKEVLVLATGIGKVQASFSLTECLNHFSVSIIINLGMAGASDDYSVGDLVFVERAKYHDFDLSLFGYALGQVPGQEEYFYPRANETIMKRARSFYRGTLLTGDKFITTKMDMNNYLVDMEGAALFHVAKNLDKDFISLKVVSDIVNKSEFKDYKEFEAEKGADILLSIFLHLLEVI